MQKSDDKRKKRGFAAGAARGLAAAIVTALIFLAVCAALISSGRTPEGAMGVMACLAAFFGALAGSVVAAKSIGSQALASGLAVSGALFALMLISAAFSTEGGLIGPVTPGLFAALIAGGILGGVLSRRRKGRKRV